MSLVLDGLSDEELALAFLGLGVASLEWVEPCEGSVGVWLDDGRQRTDQLHRLR